MEVYLAAEFAGITVMQWLVAIGVFCAISIGAMIVRRVLVTRLAKLAERTESTWDDVAVDVLESVRPTMYTVIAALIAVQFLPLPEFAQKIAIVVLAVAITYYVAQAVGLVADRIATRIGGDSDNDGHMRSAVALMSGILKILIWAASILFVVSNFGVDITSLIAGLGIGGIAVALALQNILKDLFSSFSIFFDKPFVIGDYIEVGDHSGTVQKVGVKTTRLKALSGEEIVISNQDLTTAQLHNFKRMKERRVARKIGVTYETPREKLQAIPQMIEGVVSGVENVRFSRTHLKSFDDWAITFEMVYFVESRDYVMHMDAQQAINFGILEVFEKAGIDMAYPTQTIYHKQQ